jgi:hypothetical protein
LRGVVVFDNGFDAVFFDFGRGVAVRAVNEHFDAPVMFWVRVGLGTEYCLRPCTRRVEGSQSECFTCSEFVWRCC